MTNVKIVARFKTTIRKLILPMTAVEIKLYCVSFDLTAVSLIDLVVKLSVVVRFSKDDISGIVEFAMYQEHE
jgi:hypothetical protein